MLCPVCGAVAENITKAGFDGLGVRCRNCGDFDIAATALDQFLRLQEPERVASLENARQLATGDLPTISLGGFHIVGRSTDKD